MHLQDNEAKRIYYFYKSGYIYGFVHNGSDFYTVTWNGNITLINDGIMESVFSLTDNSGTVSSGETSEVRANFDASGLVAGNYYPKIYFFTNDETAKTDMSVNLTVSGEADIDISTDQIDFGYLINTTSESSSFWISNYGCDTLFIDAIKGATSEIQLEASSNYVLGQDSLMVVVYFSPSASGSYSTTLTIENSVEEKTITVSGYGTNNPSMVVDTDTLKASISSCSGTSTQTFNISNTSSITSKMDYYIDKYNSYKISDVLNLLDNDYGSVTELIPNAYNFSISGGTNYISDGGNDMYDGSNYLSTNYESQFDYSDGVIIEGGAMGDNGSYFTRKYEDLFVLVADLDSVSYFNIYGNMGSDGGGSFDADTISVGKYIGFITRNYDAYDPSVNHLIIVEKDDLLNQTYDSGTSEENHTVSGLDGSTRLYYLLFAGTNGYYINNNDIREIMNAFLDVVGDNNFWITANPSEGLLDNGSSETISLTLDASDLTEGEYTTKIFIKSNDTINSIDTLNLLLSVSGNPEISTSSNSVILPETYATVTGSSSIMVYNTGCDILEIDSVAVTGTAFSVSDIDKDLDPGDSLEINFSWYSSSAEDLSSSLTVYTNADDATISLSATVIEPPVLSLDTEILEFSVGCDETVTATVTVTNSGSDTLRYYVGSSDNVVLVASGSSSTVNYDINTTDSPLGESVKYIYIYSNDPNNSYKRISCSISKVGEPSISLSSVNYNFSNVIIGDTVENTVWVYNTGCDTLKVTNVSGGSTSLSTDYSSFNVYPYDSVSLTISFMPQTVTDYSTTFTLENNDEDVTISVNGSGIYNPEMTVSEDTLSATIDGCGGSYTFDDFTITNSVTNSSLSYSFVSDYYAISTQYYSSSGETTNHIFTEVSSANEITLIITLNGDYTDLYYDEYATLVIEGTTIGQVNTENTTDGVDYVRTYTFSGSQVSTWLSDGTLEVDLVNSSAVDPGYGEQLNQVELIANGMPSMFTLSSTSGTIDGVGSVNITPTVNTEGMASGTYEGNIFIYSNDTTNLVDTIYYSIILNGAPEISLSENTINFPEIAVDQYTYSTITVSNDGCDTLKISNISSNNSVFYTDNTTLSIDPFSADELTIYFDADSVGSYTGTLSIESNDVNTSIALNASTANTKVKSMTTITEDGYYKAGKAIDLTLRFNKSVSIDTTNGKPTISLNSGDNVYASYVEGSGTYDLTFEYVVGSGENTDALDYDNIVSFVLNGANLVDFYGNDVDSVLPTVGTFTEFHDLVIDNIRPSVTLSSTESTPTYNSSVEVTITFSEAVIFDTNNISIENGDLSDIVTDNNVVWTATIVAQDTGNISVKVPEGAASDSATNVSTASNTLVLTYTLYISGTEITVIGDNSNTVSLYPNPSAERVYVDLGTEKANATIEIYTVNGTKIKTIENYSSNSSINVSDLISGTYILQVKTTEESVAKQLLKE